MGLREKRAIKDFEENIYPDLKKQIDSAIGFDASVDVNWDKLAQDGYDHLYNDVLPKVFFQPVIEAFTSVGSDDMGKQALKEGVKHIVLTWENGDHTPNNFSFADGILTIDHEPIVNADFVEDRTKKIIELLENGL